MNVHKYTKSICQSQPSLYIDIVLLHEAGNIIRLKDSKEKLPWKLITEKPFKYEAQTVLFKDPVRTAQ